MHQAAPSNWKTIPLNLMACELHPVSLDTHLCRETGMMKPNMNEIDRAVAVDGPVVSEGGRSPSTLTTGRAAPSGAGAPKPGPLAPGQRWSVARKREVVLRLLRLLRGESGELLSRELGLPMFKLEQWRHKAEAALDGAKLFKEACFTFTMGLLLAWLRREQIMALLPRRLTALAV